MFTILSITDLFVEFEYLTVDFELDLIRPRLGLWPYAYGPSSLPAFDKMFDILGRR